MPNDLISRSVAIDVLLRQPNTPTPSVIRRVLRQVPAVDAVEVVRCRDCVYYKQNPYNSEDIDLVCQCWIDWIPTYDNDFCSYGERRETDG